MSFDFTTRQIQVLAFINKHRATEQCNPTHMEIAIHFGWASANAANGHLKALEDKFAIVRRVNQKSRGYIVISPFDKVAA